MPKSYALPAPQLYEMHDENDESEGLPETSDEEDKGMMQRLADGSSSSHQESSGEELSETDGDSCSEESDEKSVMPNIWAKMARKNKMNREMKIQIVELKPSQFDAVNAIFVKTGTVRKLSARSIVLKGRELSEN